MNKYWRRLLWRTPEERFNPLMYPFLVATFIYGFGFAFFGDASGVANSSLFNSLTQFHELMPLVWGVLTVTIAVATIITLLFRPIGIGRTTALIGFMTWLFAAFVYALSGHWLVILTVTGPYMFFWAWFYLRVSFFSRQIRNGETNVLE